MRWYWKYRRWLHRDWNWGKRRPLTGSHDVGRWSASVDVTGLNVPQVKVYGEGEDYAYVMIGYGSPGSDPVLRLEVDLEGTALGRAIAWTWWRARQARHWDWRREAPQTTAAAAESTGEDEPDERGTPVAE